MLWTLGPHFFNEENSYPRVKICDLDYQWNYPQVTQNTGGGSIAKTKGIFFNNSGWHVGLPVVFWKSPERHPDVGTSMAVVGGWWRGWGNAGENRCREPLLPPHPCEPCYLPEGKKGCSTLAGQILLISPNSSPLLCNYGSSLSLSLYIDLLSNWLSFKLLHVWQLRTCNYLADVTRGRSVVTSMCYCFSI